MAFCLSFSWNFIEYFKLTLKSDLLFLLLSHSYWLRKRCDLEQTIPRSVKPRLLVYCSLLRSTVTRMPRCSTCLAKPAQKANNRLVRYVVVVAFMSYIILHQILNFPPVIPKGLVKLGNIVAETLLWRQLFLCLAARETYVAETDFAARKQQVLSPDIKTVLFPGHKFYVCNICFPV